MNPHTNVSTHQCAIILSLSCSLSHARTLSNSVSSRCVCSTVPLPGLYSIAGYRIHSQDTDARKQDVPKRDGPGEPVPAHLKKAHDWGHRRDRAPGGATQSLEPPSAWLLSWFGIFNWYMHVSRYLSVYLFIWSTCTYRYVHIHIYIYICIHVYI